MSKATACLFRAILLFVALAFVAAPAIAHPEVLTENSTGPNGENYQIILVMNPAPLEPGEVTFTIIIKENDKPLANEFAHIELTKNKRTFLSTGIITDAQGAAQIKLDIESAGNYNLNVNNTHITKNLLVHVHGRVVLVVGFLISLAMLFAILLDRL